MLILWVDKFWPSIRDYKTQSLEQENYLSLILSQKIKKKSLWAFSIIVIPIKNKDSTDVFSVH